MFSWDDLAVSSTCYADSFLWKCSSAATRLDVQGHICVDELINVDELIFLCHDPSASFVICLKLLAMTTYI